MAGGKIIRDIESKKNKLMKMKKKENSSKAYRPTNREVFFLSF